MKPYKLHPKAAAEYAEAKEYYTRIRPELGKRFEAEINELIAAICRHPQQYREYDPPMRRHFSRSFPYAILYHDEPERVWIVTVTHMKRHPGHWKPRLG